MSSSKEATRTIGRDAIVAGALIVAAWLVTARYLTAAFAQLIANESADTIAALTRLTWGFALFGATVGGLAVYGFASAAKHLARRIDAAEAERGAAMSMRDAIAMHGKDAVMTLAADGTILSSNRHIAGLPPDLLVGRALFDFIPYEHERTVQQRLDDVLVSGAPASFELRGAGLIDNYGWTEHRLAPVAAADGGTIVLMISRDLTQHRRMERALAERYDAADRETPATPAPQTTPRRKATVAKNNLRKKMTARTK